MKARIALTGTAWLAAFVIVSALLLLFGEQLRELPLLVRALIISGLLVTLMLNVVMPAVAPAINRRLGNR